MSTGICTAPFQFFTDHRGELADAVREGRRHEFASFAAFSDPARRAQIPDPNADETFRRSCPTAHAERGDQRRAFYRRLLGLRRALLVPHLEGARALGAEPIGPSAVLARWRLGGGAAWTLASNLGAEPCRLARPAGDVIFATANAGETLASGLLAGHTTVAFLEPSRG